MFTLEIVLISLNWLLEIDGPLLQCDSRMQAGILVRDAASDVTASINSGSHVVR